MDLRQLRAADHRPRPFEGHPADCEQGHPQGCERHRAEIAAYQGRAGVVSGVGIRITSTAEETAAAVDALAGVLELRAVSGFHPAERAGRPGPPSRREGGQR